MDCLRPGDFVTRRFFVFGVLSPSAVLGGFEKFRTSSVTRITVRKPANDPTASRREFSESEIRGISKRWSYESAHKFTSDFTLIRDFVEALNIRGVSLVHSVSHNRSNRGCARILYKSLFLKTSLSLDVGGAICWLVGDDEFAS